MADAEKPADPTPKQLAVGCVALIVLFVVGLLGLKSCTDAYDHDHPKQAAATPNRHDQRVAAQHYWDVTVDKLAVAEGYLSVAQAAAQSGDSITASSALQRAEDAAKDAGMQSVDGEPEGWTSDVAANLSAASADFAKALKSMRAFLDNGKPSEASDAKDLNAEASQEISTATAAARQHYTEMGGNAANIQSLDSKVETIMKAARLR